MKYMVHGLALLGMAAAKAAPGAEPVEVVVTTRGYEESLQSVPIAITAIDDTVLQNSGIRGVQELSRLSPSLSINEALSQNDLRITVRGLTNTRGRSNVAFLVDGVDVTSETTGTNAGSPLLINQRLLNDIERVEIVRGPQSALFGRAAFAGAISYVTREPGPEPGGRVGIEATDYGGLELSGTVSTPLGDDAGLRLNGLWWTEDGYYTNAVSAADVGGGDGRGFAGTLVYRPAETLKLKTRLTYSEDNYAIRPVARILDTVTLAVPAAALADPDGPGPLLPVTTRSSVDVVPNYGSAAGLEVRASEDALTGGEYPGNRLEVLRGTLQADWNPGDYAVSATTGFTDALLTQRYDLDRQAEARPDRIFANNDVDTIDDTRQFSQELRLTADWGGAVRLLFGGLYWLEERSSATRNLVVVCSRLAAPGSAQCAEPLVGGTGPYTSWQDIYRDIAVTNPATRVPTTGDTDHWSLYARADWQLTERLTLSLEDRYVQETFDALLATGSTCNNFYPDSGPTGFGPIQPDPAVTLPPFNFGCGLVDTQQGSERSAYQTPKFILNWQATNGLLAYVSAGKGEKPGGISLVTVPAPLPQLLQSFRFRPEKMWAYELGVKSSWDGAWGALVFNVASFYQDYSDKQTATLLVAAGFPIPVTSNASAAHVLGSEIEAAWSTPLDGLEASIAYTWLEAEYDNFVDVSSSPNAIAIQGQCNTIVTQLGTRRCVIDNSGNALEYAPEHALAAGLSYRRPLPAGFDVMLEASSRYQDEVFTTSGNFTTQSEYWQLDLRAGLSTDRLTLTLFLDNALDDDTIRTSSSIPDFGAAAVDRGIPTSPAFQNTAVLPDPRVFGIRLAYEFGDS